MRRDEIVEAARLWLGTPYHHQASLRGVWRDLHGDEPETPPPYSPSWAESLRRETLALAAERHLQPLALADARPGDVLLFRWREHLPAKHCAILTSPDRIIHAHDGAAVAEVAFTPWWRRHLSHAFSFPGVTD